MYTVKVLMPFYDLAIHDERKAGDEFDVSDARASQLENALGPGFIELAQKKPTAKRTRKTTTPKE